MGQAADRHGAAVTARRLPARTRRFLTACRMGGAVYAKAVSTAAKSAAVPVAFLTRVYTDFPPTFLLL